MIGDIQLEKALAIPGWMSPRELEFLAITARQCSNLIVEYGAYKGRSTRALVDNTDALVITIDPWNGIYYDKNGKQVSYIKTTDFDDFQLNLRDHIGRKLLPIRCKSTEYICPFQADFVFIDADHRYNEVCKDILHAIRCIGKHGIIAGHDYGRIDWPGVKQAVDELLGATEHCDTIWIKRF